MFDRAINVEPPALAADVGRRPEIECRPILRQMLPRRQTLLFGAGGLAGEEAAFARPALFASRQFAGRGRLFLVGHVTTTGYSWRCIAEACLVSRIVASMI